MDRAPVYHAWKPLRSTRHARRRFRALDLFLVPAAGNASKAHKAGNAGTSRRNRRSPGLAASLLIFALVASGGYLTHMKSTVAAPADGPRRIMSGWLPYWGTNAAMESVEKNADLFADASPFWYQLHSDGLVSKSCSCTTESQIADVVQRLHSRKIPVLPTITQVQGAPEMARFLTDQSARERHVRQIVGIVVDHGFAGIDLDYESMAFGGTVKDRIATKNGFSQLARELATALHAHGKKLVITVGARTTTSDYGNWSVYDYAAIGAVVDKFRIMTYDYGWKGGSPNPVAPYWWVDQVIAHATSLVPAGKVWLGIPSYGYDWRIGGGDATAVTYDKALALQRTYGAKREWVETDGSARVVRAPKFTYRDAKGGTHTVWYNDAASMRRLMSLVSAYKLGGAAMWSLGNEDPAMWPATRAYATSIAVASTTTAVWISAAKVRYGTTLRVKGRLTNPSGELLRGRKVSLQQRTSTGSGWSTVATGTTDANGQVGFTTTPRRWGQVRLVAGGTWSSAGATSAIRTVSVARGVSAGAAVARRGQVRTITMRGSIFPAAKGVQVSQQRWVKGRWVNVASGTTDARGQYRVVVATRSVGTPTLRVKAAGTRTHIAGASSAQQVAVR